jgi:hypothetical protein
MFLFKKSTKNKYLSPANIQLNLGVSPRNSKSISPIYQNDKKKSYSISISPDKPEKTINHYYNNPKLNLMKKITMFKNNMKNTLFTKDKPVFLDLGHSPPPKIEQTRPQLFGAKLSPASSIKINSKKLNSKKKSLINSKIKNSKKKSLINSKIKINSKKNIKNYKKK